MTYIRILIAVIAMMALPATARAKSARCAIKTADQSYEGLCEFFPERGGSFSVSAPGNTGTIAGVLTIGVAVEEANVADVRGLTKEGINSRWGRATRSTSDRACWVGDDFSICAY